MSNVPTNHYLRKSRQIKKSLPFLLVILIFLFVNIVSAQNKLSPEAVKALKAAYDRIKSPEKKSFESFARTNAHVFAQTASNTATLAVQDPYCNKVRTYCANSTFETGLDQNQYVGAYGTWFTGSGVATNLYPDPFALTYGFSDGVLSSGAAHQTIVDTTTGNDPTTGIRLTPLTPGANNRYSLRLGNTDVNFGTELIAKTIVVDPSETILSFYYAVVFQDPGHPFVDQPAFSVRVYDCATGLELPNVCNLGNNSNVAVSNAANPFFKSLNSSTFGTIAYRDWSPAQINLSAYVGKTVIIVFTNKDCGQGAHWGYTYLDNLFSDKCPVPGVPPPPPGDVRLDTLHTSTCGTGNICVKYQLPYLVTNNVVTTNGFDTIVLNIYQNSTLITTLTSPKLTTYSADSSYCFSINPATLGINTSLGGFDYAITGKFTTNTGFILAPKTILNPPTGLVPGINNDYLIVCPPANVYYSKSSGDLHSLLTWGLNSDGSGANPADFNDSVFQLANRPGVYTMTGNWSVSGTVNIPSGSQLQINGYTLSVANKGGAGTFSGSLTSNLTTLSSTLGGINLTFTAGSNSLNNLTVNAGSTATVNAALDLYNTLAIDGIFNAAPPSDITPYFTFKSGPAMTARMAPVTGTIGFGNMRTEQYIPARRAWRLMNSPVLGSSSVSTAWREGALSTTANPNPGYGTHVTGGQPYESIPGTQFDINFQGAMSSIKQYNNATNSWDPLPSLAGVGVTSPKMIFIRGDRSITLGLNTVTPTVTRLRDLGTFTAGNKIYTVFPTGFTALPNPYQSPINFATLTRVNVMNNFYVWDPKMGGPDGVGAYVLISGNSSGTYDVIPASVSPESQYIQTNQSFMVMPETPGTPGSITFKESDKVAVYNNVFRTSGTATTAVPNAPVIADPKSGQGLRITLETTNADKTIAVMDEVFTSYKSNYSGKVDNMDGVKMPNMAENLGIVREGRTLMLERKPLVDKQDVISLKLWNTTAQEYQLEFDPVNLNGTGLTATLEDAYLRSSTPVSLTEISRVKFAVSSDPASARTDRFKVVLSNKNAVPDAVTITAPKQNITAYPNPIDGRNLTLNFTNEQEGMYQVILVNSIGRIVFKKDMQHAGGSVTYNLALGKKLQRGVYQLHVTGKSEAANINVISN